MVQSSMVRAARPLGLVLQMEPGSWISSTKRPSIERVARSWDASLQRSQIQPSPPWRSTSRVSLAGARARYSILRLQYHSQRNSGRICRSRFLCLRARPQWYTLKSHLSKCYHEYYHIVCPQKERRRGGGGQNMNSRQIPTSIVCPCKRIQMQRFGNLLLQIGPGRTWQTSFLAS